jgi:Fe-S-cluster containining protein
VAQESLWLKTEQVLKAIRLDFRGYGSQPVVFCEVIRTIHGDDMIVKREPGKDGLWISRAGKGRMRWLHGADLVEFMCAEITRIDLEPPTLAAICTRVFQAACHVENHAETGLAGIRIDTGMSAFECRQCGRCCRKLDYRDGMTADDMARLRALDRQDILKWVSIKQSGGDHEEYRIWVEPGTNQFAETCPFLKRGPSESLWVCRIHDVKPQVCRHYPVSRKHARMTGCPGFDKKREPFAALQKRRRPELKRQQRRVDESG